MSNLFKKSIKIRELPRWCGPTILILQWSFSLLAMFYIAGLVHFAACGALDQLAFNLGERTSQVWPQRGLMLTNGTPAKRQVNW